MKILCGVCNRSEEDVEVRRPLRGWVEDYNLPPYICTDCFGVWYKDKVRDLRKIKEIVLRGIEECQKIIL